MGALVIPVAASHKEAQENPLMLAVAKLLMLLRSMAAARHLALPHDVGIRQVTLIEVCLVGTGSLWSPLRNQCLWHLPRQSYVSSEDIANANRLYQTPLYIQYTCTQIMGLDKAHDIIAWPKAG